MPLAIRNVVYHVQVSYPIGKDATTYYGMERRSMPEITDDPKDPGEHKRESPRGISTGEEGRSEVEEEG
jgi:hypothetical protein